MKTKILLLILAFCFLGSLPVKTVALNYTITFTGTGLSSTVNNVIVQNLTKGTSVTVPAGNVLNLSDAPNAVLQVSANNEPIHIYPVSADGKTMVSFFSKQAGVTQLNAYSLDGRKVAGIITDLQAGSNKFELSLPRGVFVIQVTGNEYAYTAKLLNSSGTHGIIGIVYTGTEKPLSSGLQKTKSSTLGVTTMTYAAGDQLLYKGISGNYSTIVTDVPTDDKTTNFNFVVCTDADGNNYTSVTIGTQTWMAENLKTTNYNDGSLIANVTDNTAWLALSTPAYCWNNNDAATFKNTYGALYNWYTVNTGKLAPTGWHVPTDAEWTTLTNFLGTESVAGGKLKETGTGTWFMPNTSATNETGFSARPGGQLGSGGVFGNVGSQGNWWCYSDATLSRTWIRPIDKYYSEVIRGYDSKASGNSVRCVKD